MKGEAKFVMEERADRLAKRWLELRHDERSLVARRVNLRQGILKEIRRIGQQAPRAKHMRELRGFLFKVQAVFGHEAIVNQDAARKFLRAAPRSLGRKMFRREERYVYLAPGLDALIRAENRLSKLFWRAVKLVPREPRVQVRKIKRAERAKAA